MPCSTMSSALEAAPPGKSSISYLVNAVQPEWIVLRPFELNELRTSYPEQAAHYRIVKSFTTDAQLRYGPASFFSVDESYVILRRSYSSSTDP